MSDTAMTMEDMVLVSVDDHVCEPADMFVRHIPARFKDAAPHVVDTDYGQAWVIEGKKVPGMGLNAVVGWPKEEYGAEPTAFEHLRKGCYDIHARIDDMDANGVLGSINFPQFPGFAGMRFIRQADKGLALATIRAYNDWHIQDWVGPYPGRMIPIAILPLWDIDLAVEELTRCARQGVHAVSFSDNPALLGLPSLHSPYWERLWSACEDLEVVICAHIGTGAAAPHASDESPVISWITSMPISIANSAADWLFASFWSRHPRLRLALSEGSIGWVPYFLERAEYALKQHGAWTNLDLGGLTPTEIFQRHFITCFIEDRFGIKNLDAIGIDNVTWECDYPHSDTPWPCAPERLWDEIKQLSRQEIDKITHLNAMRDFRYDPFTAMGGRENCTVAALRAAARRKGVDTREVAGMGGISPRFAGQGPVTSGEIIKILTAA